MLRVIPIYGWGWKVGDEMRFDPPCPFNLDAEESGPRRWQGMVLDEDHEFADRHVKLSQRHSRWDGHVNVVIEPAEPLEDRVIGYATVEGAGPSALGRIVNFLHGLREKVI